MHPRMNHIKGTNHAEASVIKASQRRKAHAETATPKTETSSTTQRNRRQERSRRSSLSKNCHSDFEMFICAMPNVKDEP